MFCNSDMISSTEGILFEYRTGPKVIIISEDMLFDAIRKTIMDAIRGCKFLLEDECIKLKCDDDMRKIFFIFLEFSSKCSIELNVTFGRSPNEILALLCNPRKS